MRLVDGVQSRCDFAYGQVAKAQVGRLGVVAVFALGTQQFSCDPFVDQERAVRRFDCVVERGQGFVLCAVAQVNGIAQ